MTAEFIDEIDNAPVIIDSAVYSFFMSPSDLEEAAAFPGPPSNYEAMRTWRSAMRGLDPEQRKVTRAMFRARREAMDRRRARGAR